MDEQLEDCWKWMKFGWLREARLSLAQYQGAITRAISVSEQVDMQSQRERERESES
jgi:hypothetical protein